jgi:hypothetical protein
MKKKRQYQKTIAFALAFGIIFVCSSCRRDHCPCHGINILQTINNITVGKTF